MKDIKVLIVDDKDIIRKGLRSILSQYGEIKIEAEATDGYEALNLIAKNKYDVVLMDINMPNMDGIEATKSIRAINRDIKILSNSSFISTYHVREMLKAGAAGFIKKGEDAHLYQEAIWTIDNGGIFLSEEIEAETYDEVFNFLKQSKAIA
jgi:two-component system, NarL family, response regulator DegU